MPTDESKMMLFIRHHKYRKCNYLLCYCDVTVIINISKNFLVIAQNIKIDRFFIIVILIYVLKLSISDIEAYIWKPWLDHFS